MIWLTFANAPYRPKLKIDSNATLGEVRSLYEKKMKVKRSNYAWTVSNGLQAPNKRQTVVININADGSERFTDFLYRTLKLKKRDISKHLILNERKCFSNQAIATERLDIKKLQAQLEALDIDNDFDKLSCPILFGLITHIPIKLHDRFYSLHPLVEHFATQKRKFDESKNADHLRDPFRNPLNAQLGRILQKRYYSPNECKLAIFNHLIGIFNDSPNEYDIEIQKVKVIVAEKLPTVPSDTETTSESAEKEAVTSISEFALANPDILLTSAFIGLLFAALVTATIALTASLSFVPTVALASATGIGATAISFFALKNRAETLKPDEITPTNSI